MEVQESLKRFRKGFNLKQRDVAAILGITPQAYQVYEKKVTPSAKVIVKLAEHYKVTADYLLGLSDNPAPVEKPADDAPVTRAEFEELKAKIEKLNLD